MEYSDKQIGRNIKAIRNANKKSYLDFADAIGISDSLLEKIENGTRHATDEIIQFIANNTGFSFSEIKFKDLSHLEKGEMYFEEDLSVGDFTEISKLDTSFVDIMKLLFPIVEDQNRLKIMNLTLACISHMIKFNLAIFLLKNVLMQSTTLFVQERIKYALI